ncbi:MAG: HAD-IC family P-type ATPase, partial [Clostridia bacterium]|nr:HAD-IC family P-type ATPase [Clostridia bacterium]
ALAVAAAIENKSNHPRAECVLEYAQSVGYEKKEAQEYLYTTGRGAQALVDGIKYYLGNKGLLPKGVLKTVAELEKKYERSGKTVIFLATDKELVAAIAIADELKETSKEAVESLKVRGVTVGMLTGDAENVAKAISERVGIDKYYAESLPEDKANAVKTARELGGVVAMVGDGVNDSPALKAADLGVAMGTGTDIAIDSADVVLVGGDLNLLSVMIDLSKAAVRNIKQNLFWALFYNCVAIPVAAGALAFAGVVLNPMMAAACMSLRSLVVVTNALRLTRFGKKEKENNKEKTGMVKTLKIEGMMCPRCVAHVEKALSSVNGVESVEVNLKKKTAKVVGETVVESEMRAAIEEAGYEVKEIR